MSDITYSTLEYKDLSDIQTKYYQNGFDTGYIKANGVVLPAYFEKMGQRIQDMDVRDDDIWVCSLMKTGTTWCQEMSWCIANDLNFEGAKESLHERFPYLECTALGIEKIKLEKPDLQLPEYLADSVEFVNGMKSPRFIKTHLPYKLLPKKLRDQSTKAKIIYVARNPKDTCLSLFHHWTLFMRYTGNFEEICELFVTDSIYYSPVFDHILGYWERSDDSQLLFLKYEDMKWDLRSVIRKTAQFLGKSLLDDQVSVLEKHLSFESMKKNEAVNFKSFVESIRISRSLNTVDGNFMRSGTVGEGRTKMTPEYVKVFDEWEEKCLGKTVFKF